MIGTKYKIPEKIRPCVRILADNIETHKEGMRFHAEQAKINNKKLWDVIMAEMPEIESKKYNYSLDHDESEIYCVCMKDKQ